MVHCRAGIALYVDPNKYHKHENLVQQMALNCLHRNALFHCTSAWFRWLSFHC